MSPFAVLVGYDGAKTNIKNVGYGVSQALPLVLELITGNKGCYMIQQPEVHLHPRAQASFGDALFAFVNEGSRLCFVETHSDFLIDRYRLAMSKSKSGASCQVLFCERDGALNKLTSLAIDANGRYPEDQPDSFRRFFLNESLAMLGM